MYLFIYFFDRGFLLITSYPYLEKTHLWSLIQDQLQVKNTNLSFLLNYLAPVEPKTHFASIHQFFITFDYLKGALSLVLLSLAFYSQIIQISYRFHHFLLFR